VLSPLDESLFHQIPSTFDHVGTSDPRFFDRWWFAAYDPDGGGAIQLTLAVYNNMNVCDAGLVVIADGLQHNVRASRSLRPRFATEVGPFRVEVLEPLRRLRLVAEPGDGRPVGVDLEWRAVTDPEEERPHFHRVRGRITEEYQRYDQIGEVSGTVTFGDGRRLDVARWWACRDHSWGVRQNAGIPEPVTGPAPAAGADGFLFSFLFFSTGRLAGHVQIAERGERREYLTGLIRDVADGSHERRVVDATLALDLQPSTRRFASATMDLMLDDGSAMTVRSDALGPSIAMPGLGYSGGWNDGRGLGVWRGDEYLEHEVWDVRHPVDVIDVADAARPVTQPVHRIQPVRVTVARAPDGGFDDEGTGSHTLLPNGRLPQYGLGL
jgi:hypothetical protein